MRGGPVLCGLGCGVQKQVVRLRNASMALQGLFWSCAVVFALLASALQPASILCINLWLNSTQTRAEVLNAAKEL